MDKVEEEPMGPPPDMRSLDGHTVFFLLRQHAEFGPCPKFMAVSCTTLSADGHKLRVNAVHQRVPIKGHIAGLALLAVKGPQMGVLAPLLGATIGGQAWIAWKERVHVDIVDGHHPAPVGR